MTCHQGSFLLEFPRENLFLGPSSSECCGHSLLPGCLTSTPASATAVLPFSENLPLPLFYKDSCNIEPTWIIHGLPIL